MLAIVTVQLAVNGAIMKQDAGPTRKRTARLMEPELMLAPDGGSPDPRLVELARLLARRAARKWYHHLAEERCPKRS